MNRLKWEKSPYLLQHASNPVDWFPWGKEAFTLAKQKNLPIFLSIGYSTCHWCHVMERESFEDKTTAEYLNANFINVKVDREIHTGVDQFYMNFVTSTTGSGGWPLSVWLTPELKPFFGGTYFPPTQRFGTPSFLDVCRTLSNAWNERRTDLTIASDDIVTQLRAAGGGGSSSSIPQLVVCEKAIQTLTSSFDKEMGGFSKAPKFPTPSIMNFLFSSANIKLKNMQFDESSSINQMALHTLNCINDGGIHDHVGGGFHRYSTDSEWFVPHFEKMLYDQAQLLNSFVDAFNVTKDRVYRNASTDIITFLKKDMMNKKGGFFSAIDADSYDANDNQVKEGAYYIWDILEIKDEMFRFVFNIKESGNIVEGELSGKNLPRKIHTYKAASEKFQLSVDSVEKQIETYKSSLLELRMKRKSPFLDTKIITSWNSMLISALCKAYLAFDNNQEYLSLAKSCSNFISENLYLDGFLYRSVKDGELDKHHKGSCSDYAHFISSLIDLYGCDYDKNWIDLATSLQSKQDELFWDKIEGGYFSSDGDSIPFRVKDEGDYAEPSSNSISLKNLIRLACFDEKYLDKAEKILLSSAKNLHRYPHAYPEMLIGLQMFHGNLCHVITLYFLI
jgi:uncharacterized protein YyaL (SSP411 family)